MRVLITADAVGGVWTYVLDLARGLQPLSWEAVVAVNGPPPNASALAEARAAGVSVEATGLPLDWLADTPGEVEAAGRALAVLARRLDVDVVQLNAPAYAAGAGFDRPVVAVQHSCTATWWRAVRGDAPWPADFGWRFDLARRGLLACDRTVAPTAAFARAVADAYAVAPPAVVPNGRAPLAAPPRDKAAPYVFTSGRLWDEGKGMAVLDAAAARLPAPVIAAGPLAGPTGGEAAFQHLRTPGRLDAAALVARLAGAAVFASPSLYEPFGLSVLEAAQLARPLVLSDIATFRELWEGGAVFTPPGDAGALAEALAALLADPDRRASLGAAAAERARRYTVEAMAEGMARIYRSRLAPDQLQS